MFHIYKGFNLVEAYHDIRNRRKHITSDNYVSKIVKALFVLIVTLTLWNMPTECYGIEGLTIVQQRIIAIFAYATFMWILEVIPSWATSVSIILLMILTTSDSGIAPLMYEEAGEALSYKSIMASFADPVVMLFIGGFVLAIAATKTGLDAQLAKALLKPFGNRSSIVLLGFILITGFFSMFVSNTATAAMMLTFLTPVFKQLPPEGKGRIAMTLAIPVAANIGGMATPIGTPPNAIALKYLNDPSGLDLNLGFGEWMMFMFPLTIVLLLIGWGLLLWLFPFSQKTVDIEIEGEMKKDVHTWIVIVTFIITVLLWMFDKLTGINSYTVAFIPFCVFAISGVVTKRDLEQINWSVIWMVAGGFALGYGLNSSGLASNAVESIPFGEWSPMFILVVSGLVCYFLSNFISNSATAALLMPILAVVCTGMGDKLDAIGGTPTVLIGIAIAASSAMLLPISTPPNALAFSTNLVNQNQMLKVGAIVGVISMVLGYALLYVMGSAHII